MAERPKPDPATAADDPTRAPDALARLAHELRTPLSAIAAAAEIMRDEQFGPIGDARYRGYSGDILYNARHALGVINSMLGGLKPGTGTVTPPGPREQAAAAPAGAAPETALVFAEIDTNDLVARVASGVRALLESARIEAVTDLAPRLPHVIADAVTIRQILLNLVSNAIRATPAGGRVTLSTSYVPAGPLVIAVSDTGIGMDEASLARSLAGETGAAGASGFPDGTGLGLPIVARLAALNGARISIESTPGKGTRAAVAFDSSRVVPV